MESILNYFPAKNYKNIYDVRDELMTCDAKYVSNLAQKVGLKKERSKAHNIMNLVNLWLKEVS